jgi:hypothetical protein
MNFIGSILDVPLEIQFSFEIFFSDLFAHGFCKFFDPHFLNQTEIVDFEVVRVFGGPMGIGLIVRTGEFTAVAAELNPFFPTARKYSAGFCLLLAADNAVLAPAA